MLYDNSKRYYKSISVDQPENYRNNIYKSISVDEPENYRDNIYKSISVDEPDNYRNSIYKSFIYITWYSEFMTKNQTNVFRLILQ